MKDEETGRSRGFGFVNMESVTAGAKAVEELNGHEVRGRLPPAAARRRHFRRSRALSAYASAAPPPVLAPIRPDGARLPSVRSCMAGPSP
eukprot:7385684-Prymnesium_polylepis.1